MTPDRPSADEVSQAIATLQRAYAADVADLADEWRTARDTARAAGASFDPHEALHTLVATVDPEHVRWALLYSDHDAPPVQALARDVADLLGAEFTEGNGD